MSYDQRMVYTEGTYWLDCYGFSIWLSKELLERKEQVDESKTSYLVGSNAMQLGVQLCTRWLFN